jgi:hypothetical protein
MNIPYPSTKTIKFLNPKWLERKLLEINELYKLYEHQRLYLEKNYQEMCNIQKRSHWDKKLYRFIRCDKRDELYANDYSYIKYQVKQMRIKLIQLRDKIGIGLTSHIKLNYKAYQS